MITMKEMYEALWHHEDQTRPIQNTTVALVAYKEMKFREGDKVRKVSGAQWKGTVVGYYSTSLTQEGYAVESDTEVGSVQIYPAKALEKME